jgi:hypothetical protein
MKALKDLWIYNTAWRRFDRGDIYFDKEILHVRREYGGSERAAAGESPAAVGGGPAATGGGPVAAGGLLAAGSSEQAPECGTGAASAGGTDRGELYVIPGLIDIHMHIESSMTTPTEFSNAVLPHGTTTIVADCHEVANVSASRALNRT